MIINLGFLTNNAGDDIPGSTIKYTLKHYHRYFNNVIVVDGRLTDSAREFYKTIPNIIVVDSPWDGRHSTQYIKRNQYSGLGSWLLALDCDEMPSLPLAENLPKIVEEAESKGITMIGLTFLDFWCKHNSNVYYHVNGNLNPENPAKFILYKVLEDTKFIVSKTHTHVTPYQTTGNRSAINLPILHFKSPEVNTFNIAICIMDDLRPIGEAPDGGLRGFTLQEVEDLESLGKKYNLLGKENFRRATKLKAWPKEFSDYVKRFKTRKGFCRTLYTLYFVMLKALEDTDPLTYEEACETIGTYNEGYNKSLANGNTIVVEHTPVLLEDPNLPCGAG